MQGKNIVIPFSFLLAWRFSIAAKKEQTISTMIILSFLGIMVGTCTLALTIFVMRGFEKATYAMLQGTHPDVIMRTHAGELNIKKINEVLAREFTSVIATSPYCTHHVIVQHDDNDDYDVVLLRGINPKTEQSVTTFATTIQQISGEENISLEDMLNEKNDTVLVGSAFAQKNNLKPGMSIFLLAPEHDNEQEQTDIKQFSRYKVTISGLFKTGVDEFDTSIFFCSLSLLQKICPESIITHLGLRVNPTADQQKLLSSLRKRFGVEVFSWTELYKPILAALSLERYVMLFILSLIILVAGMTIVSFLFMLITQQQFSIALLKAMGMHEHSIKNIFMGIGLGLSLVATILGLLIAIFSAFIIEHYRCIKLPDAYVISHLPADITITSIIFVFSLVMMLTILATWFAIRTISTINCAKILKFEG